MLVPTSAAHLRDCDIFPYPITLAADIDTDFSTYTTLLSDAFHYGVVNDSNVSDRTQGKYARASALFAWVFQNGPGVTNAADFLAYGNGTATVMYTNNPTGTGTEYGPLDTAGNAVHYLLTGYDGSWTRVGQYACRWGHGSFPVERGGRGAFHAIEATMYAYLLDIDDVSYSGTGEGPYTRAEHISNLATLIGELKAYWSSGDMCLPIPVAGFLNVDGNNSYGPDYASCYMNAMMHCAAMRAFIRLAGESTTLDNHRSGWETGLLNFCDVVLNDGDGWDDTSGVNVWAYSFRMKDGTNNIRWGTGQSTGTAEAGTDSNTIVCTGLFADASVGNVVYNRDRDEFDTIASITSSDEVELTGSITSQTSGDWILVEDGEYADQSFPGTTAWQFWHSGFVNNVYGYAKDVAAGAQAVEFTAAFRTGLAALITRYGQPGTSNTFGLYNIGSGNGYYQAGSVVDAVGINAIVGMGLIPSNPWLGESD
jgi:hypothetical protein